MTRYARTPFLSTGTCHRIKSDIDAQERLTQRPKSPVSRSHRQLRAARLLSSRRGGLVSTRRQLGRAASTQGSPSRCPSSSAARCRCSGQRLPRTRAAADPRPFAHARFAPAVADAPPWLPHRSPSQRTMGFHGVVLTPFSVHALPLPLHPPQSPSIDCCRRPKNRRTEREPSLVSHFFHERAAERDAPQCQTCYARGSGLEPPKIWRPA